LTQAFALLLLVVTGFLNSSRAAAETYDLKPYFGVALNAPVKTVTLERAAPAPSPRVTVYSVVRSGDTLAGIAGRFGLSVRDLKLANGMTKDALQPGVTLKVPVPMPRTAVTEARAPRLPPGARWHTVARGETLSGIIARFGHSQDALVDANPGLRSLDQIKPGERLIIPGSSDGAYVRLKKGDDLLDIAANYGMGLDELILANEVRDLGALQTGDYVVLPGVSADATAKRLAARRAAEAQLQAQAQFDLARANKARARAALLEQRAQMSNVARSNLRTAQRNQTARVRRASANYSFPRYGGGYIWPMRGVITSGYGRRGFWIGNSNFHTGVDIASGYGAPIYAAQSGYVTQAGYGMYGLNVWVNVGGGVENIYGHMSRLAVYSGTYIERGQLLGYEGCSGICTGPHLHFEVRVGGQHVNPLRYLP
jgi:murein DD-endopeptidase MepM/ murein hydrolase activator NlpD